MSTEGVYSRDMGRGNSREGGGGDRHREVEAPQRLVDLFGEADLPRATAAEHGEEAPGGGVGTATEQDEGLKQHRYRLRVARTT